MHVTIYNLDGTVNREVECENVDIKSNFIYIIPKIEYGIETIIYKDVIMTNLPICFYRNTNPYCLRTDLLQNKFIIKMIDCHGRIIRQWDNCFDYIFYSNSTNYIGFNCDNKEWAVSGSCIVEMMKEN